jgi:hypothetical protein
MASLTLSIPNEIKKKMADFKYINWSEIARAAILEKMEVLEKMDRLLSQSGLSEKETIDYGRRLKKKEWARTERALK